MRVHLAREHALELELGELRVDATEVLFDGADHPLVSVGFGHVEQFGRLVEATCHLVERRNHPVELAALATEFLCALRVLPDGRVFELPQDFRQPLSLAGVVKGTP